MAEASEFWLCWQFGDCSFRFGVPFNRSPAVDGYLVCGSSLVYFGFSAELRSLLLTFVLKITPFFKPGFFFDAEFEAGLGLFDFIGAFLVVGYALASY